MNNSIKTKIASAYEASTPDILQRIKVECQNTEQLEYMGNIVPVRKTGRIWYQLAAMAAVLLVVSTLSMKIGRMSAIVPTVENTAVTDDSVAGTNQEVKESTKIEIEVEPGIKVTVDENLKITGAVLEDKEMEKKLKDQGIIGMDASSGLELIHKLVNEVTKVDNTTIIDTKKPSENQAEKPIEKSVEKTVEKEVEQTLDDVEVITDTATDIVEDVTKTTTNIIDDATDTTVKVIDDVEDSVEKILKIFQ